jgi:hypothetical protein
MKDCCFLAVFTLICMKLLTYFALTATESSNFKCDDLIFGPKRKKVTGGWRKLHNDELHGCVLLILFSLALQPSAGYCLLVTRCFLITYNDAPQSVGIFLDEWAVRRRNRYLTTHTTDKHPCSQWNSNPRSQQASGRTPTPWPRGHWGRLHGCTIQPNIKSGTASWPGHKACIGEK